MTDAASNNNIIHTRSKNAGLKGSDVTRLLAFVERIHLHHKAHNGSLWQIVKYTPNYSIESCPTVKGCSILLGIMGWSLRLMKTCNNRAGAGSGPYRYCDSCRVLFSNCNTFNLILCPTTAEQILSLNTRPQPSPLKIHYPVIIIACCIDGSISVHQFQPDRCHRAQRCVRSFCCTHAAKIYRPRFIKTKSIWIFVSQRS